MDYIRQSLGEDEELVYVAHFHWMYTLSAILNIAFGGGLAILLIVGAIAIEPYLPAMLQSKNGAGNGWLDMVRDVNPSIKILAFLVMAMGLFRYAQMMIIK